jgi:hypothetical protein
MHLIRKRRGRGASAAVWAGAAILVAAFTPQASRAQEQTERGLWYSGYNAARGDNYVFSGATVALNGDLDKDGYHLRVSGGWVAYDLNPGHGRGYQGDVMLGYRATRGIIDSGLYLGVDFQHYDPDDPTEEVRGTEWGFKVAADLETDREETSIYFALAAEYSTSFQTYWTRARVGPSLLGFAFGPEAAAFGDVGFDAQRLGAFFIWDLKVPGMSPVEVTLYGGHQFVAGSGGDGVGGGVGGGEGPYGGISFSTRF